MKIRDVEFIGLRSALPQPAQFSWGSAASRNVGLVRVTTVEGVVGAGETSVTFPLWSLEERALTVREGLRPLALGKDASDIEGLAALRELSSVPIAAGENAYGRSEALRLIEAEAADVVMPDVARCGGLGNARAMIAAAREKCVPYSPHQYASEVGFVTCLHLCAAEPGYLHVLRDTSPWPLRHEILTEPLRIEGGRAWLPNGPGLGVELDEATLQRYRIV